MMKSVPVICSMLFGLVVMANPTPNSATLLKRQQEVCDPLQQKWIDLRCEVCLCNNNCDSVTYPICTDLEQVWVSVL